MTDIILAGCATRPLASHLKALGIFRLVCEQKDGSCRAFWQDGKFVLRTRLSMNELRHFFAVEYRPTPLVSPWNGGSGFYPSDNKDGINGISQSTTARLAPYRKVIDQVLSWPEFEGIEKKDKKSTERIRKDSKQVFLQRCRSMLPDCCLDWLDAAYAVREDKTAYPPLLGTGGNEGRFEYVNNFMQYAGLIIGSGLETRLAWLDAALQDAASGGFPTGKMAQFDPGSAGGTNQGYEFKFEKTRGNPWDYVFMMEGTLLLAASLVRRSPADLFQAGAPFTASSNAFAGFASSGLSDNSRGEIWLPVWSRPASLRELRKLFGEGRMCIGRNQAKSGSEFVMAASSLGFDRGVERFERYSFLERRGQSYVAMPCGSVSAGCRPDAVHLREIWAFILNLRRHDLLPSLASKVHMLEECAFSCAQAPDAAHYQAVCRALAAVDSDPCLPALQIVPASCRLSGEMIRLCDDGSVEVRLAAALASLYGKKGLGGIRANLAPVDRKNPFEWDLSSSCCVSREGGLYATLSRVLVRRLEDGPAPVFSPLASRIRLNPSDLVPLLRRDIDTGLCSDLLRCFSMMAYMPETPPAWREPLAGGRLPCAAALLKLLHAEWNADFFHGMKTSQLCCGARIARLMSEGRLEEACTLAFQRLRFAGGTEICLPQSIGELVRGLDPETLTAAMLVPVDMERLYFQHACI